MSQFAHAAKTATGAGFDGVEVQGANGYLVEPFLKDGANQRTGAYRGDVPCGMRFALKVLQAVVVVWGPDRVALRICPRGIFNDMSDWEPLVLYSQLGQR